MDQHTTLSDQPNSDNNGGNDMVTELTSMIDGDKAPSTVDGDVALHGNLLDAPRNLFTASSSSRQQWWLKKKKNLSRQPPLNSNNGDKWKMPVR